MLTIQQSSQLTGKSEKTIRRLIKRLLDTDKNATKNIQQVPYPGGFTYRIDKEYLLIHTQSPTQASNHEAIQGQPQATQPASQQDNQLLKSKDETIGILTKEIDRLHEEIRELLERDKERNILFHKFQDALMIEAPKRRVDASSLTAHEVDTQNVQEGSQGEQSKPQPMDTKHNQNEKSEKSDKANPRYKQPQKGSRQSKKIEKAQPKKKGFFSFLTGK